MPPARADWNPLRHLELGPGEGALFGLLALLVGSLFAGYTVAKVLRDSMFLHEYGATALPWGYLGVALASIAIVAVDARVTARLARAGTAALGQTVALALSIAFAALYPFHKHLVAGLFYVWAGSQAMMLMSYFWLLALELWDSRRAQAILPMFSGAGLLGGVVGGGFANWAVGRIGIDGLLWALAIVLLAVRIITTVLDRRLPVRPFLTQAAAGTSWVSIVRKSKFLRYLAGTLALSVAVSTLVDFQFKYAAQEAFPDSHSLTRFLGLFYAGLNGLALVVQFGAAGWIVKRTGVFFSTLPQPLSILVFAAWIIFSPIFGVILGLRWVQGVLFQTVGKSSFELYFMAVRPAERQKVKPAIDTLVERLADAAVGIALLAVMHTIGFNMRVIAGITAIAATAWLVMLIRLQRRYVGEFRTSLEQHRSELPITTEGLQLPSARRALLAALRSDDEAQVALALRLAARVRTPKIRPAIVACLEHPSPDVRAAAVRTLDTLGVTGLDSQVEPLLAESDLGLRGAAIGWCLAHGSRASERARALLEGSDEDSRALALAVLVERPRLIPGMIGAEWLDARLAAGAEPDLVAAARALTLVSDAVRVERLPLLLEHPLVEVRRAALETAARCPAPERLEQLFPRLLEPDLAAEAGAAIAALGDAAIPALVALADGAQGGKTRALACDTLSRIGSRSALAVLLRLVRGEDPRARYDGLRALNRIRVRSSSGLIKKAQAFRLWQREVEDLRDNLLPAHILRGAQDARVVLLAASFTESADRALDRSCRALACYYRPEPFRSVYRYLQNPDSPKAAARALEYLAHLVPRRRFGPLRELFESAAPFEGTEAAPTDGQIAGCIERGYAIGDAWLRACAVRAAHAIADRVPLKFDPRADEDPLVVAELDAYQAAYPAAGAKA